MLTTTSPRALCAQADALRAEARALLRLAGEMPPGCNARLFDTIKAHEMFARAEALFWRAGGDRYTAAQCDDQAEVWRREAVRIGAMEVRA